MENQAVFYGTNEAVVDEDVFERVQQIREKRHRATSTGKSSIFSGLVYCADCGKPLYYCTTKDFEKRQHFISVMGNKLRLDGADKIRASKKQFVRDEKRINELKRLFIRIYEDNASRKLSDERFDMLSQSYEAEQKQLEAEVIDLQRDIEVQEQQAENIEKFIQTAHKYVGLAELDRTVLHELVQGIYVEEPDKSSSKCRQAIHIKYNGIGFIPLNELMK